MFKEPSYYNHPQLIDPFIKASRWILKKTKRKKTEDVSEKRAEDRHRVTKGREVEVHDVVRRHFEIIVLNNMSKRAFENILGRTAAL